MYDVSFLLNVYQWLPIVIMQVCSYLIGVT